MAYFAGLDVGLEETAICIIDGDGRIVRELTACSEPEALVGALQAVTVGYGGRPRRGCSRAWRRPSYRSCAWRSAIFALPSRP